MLQIELKVRVPQNQHASQNSIVGFNSGNPVENELPNEQHERHEEKHIDAGQLLKAIIYGGLDGSTAIIIVILSGISSNTSAFKILGITIPTLIGHAIGMGLGDYLSAKSQIQYIQSERQRQMYEIDNLVDVQKNEIIQIYTAIDRRTKEPKYSLEDATRVADLYATNKQAFTKIMILEELHLVTVDPETAKKSGIATFFSFVIFGLIPAIPYIISAGIMKSQTHQWVAVICIGAVELFGLGWGKAAMIGLNVWKSGIQTLILGSFLSAVGYALGFAFPG